MKNLSRYRKEVIRVEYIPLSGETAMLIPYSIGKGYGVAFVNTNPKREGHVVLLHIWVPKEYRRQKIGTTILNALKREYNSIETRVDSKAGLEWILANDLRTPDGKTYYWVKESIDAKDEKGKEDNSADEKNIR